jgi:8-oxo-dGTP pyrophosphatase MutT (NUDIX family)
MQKKLLSELKKLKNKKHVNKDIYKKFYTRIHQSKKGLLKHENRYDHFCVFFLPYDAPSQSVYLGHHIKADDWISPGGHIDKDEHPLKTVKREFFEELNHALTNERIEIFDITVKYIDSTLHNCKIHWDLWYMVHVNEKKDYPYIKKEYYNAGWFELNKALKKIKKNPNYKKTVEKLSTIMLLTDS